MVVLNDMFDFSFFFSTARVAATLFAAGRMAYLFDLDAPADLPTMNMRAFAARTVVGGGGGRTAQRSMVVIPGALIEDVGNALAYGSGRKHSKRRTTEAPVAASKTEQVLKRK